MFLQSIYNRRNGRTFLTDTNIYAINRFSGFKIFFLIDNGIDGDTCFPRLAVAND